MKSNLFGTGGCQIAARVEKWCPSGRTKPLSKFAAASNKAAQQRAHSMTLPRVWRGP